MKQLSVVISGFASYPGVERNPSHEVPQAFAQAGLGDEPDDLLDDVDLSVNTVELPVSLEQAWPRLKETLDATHPDIVIATGMKKEARGILLERCATNVIDTSRRLAQGYVPSAPAQGSDATSRKPVDPQGPAGFWTRLPLRAILDDFGSHGIPSALSSDAGTFLGNLVFYNLMRWSTGQERCLAGLVSFPVITDEPHPRHGLSLDQQVEACRAVVRQSARYYLDPSSSDILIA
ncbi:pyroglutamyl-peptidase I [Bifidobacterium sp. ESL0763]|uniref:pyroglutamyl-peptidase I family protein n=1 Tax=Bifidobacterium sp. ESL0763 TaxID=2983227 RepID=UPI0023F7B5EB|nr:pyroglutamyl-peptidase I [Bifidobacterium sp. ESL0763]MDF7664309.1 pyroglutamyl-peptidase I [Bifidobacterium sp. ESL0763]